MPRGIYVEAPDSGKPGGAVRPEPAPGPAEPPQAPAAALARREIEYVDVAALTPYARNPRTHSAEQVAQIAASIREFGFTNPVLIDEGGGLIAGHGRALAAGQVGMAQVPCLRLPGLSEAQKRALVIADNKLALNAGWDLELLLGELTYLGEAGFDLDLTGFSLEEIKGLRATGGYGLTEDDDAPGLEAQAVTARGEVWTLGSHRLMCGDAVAVDQARALMAGELADLLVTDPPYNVAYSGGSKKRTSIHNDALKDDAFRGFLRDAFTSADAHMKPGAVFYIWHADIEGYNFLGAAADIGWAVRQILIWNKSQLMFGRADYHWKHEPCLYGWKAGASHLWASDRTQTTVLDFERPSRSDLHPTMKPVALMKYQIENNTKGEDVVLDLFGGSGSTLIACESAGRRARLMEIDPRYCDVIIRRWQAYTGREALRVSDGVAFDALAPAGATEAAMAVEKE